MGKEEPESRSGDPTPPPPATPKRTPSPIVPDTPQNNIREQESSVVTPRFAEEYSVFDRTPGNLAGVEATSVDLFKLISSPPRIGQKRPSLSLPTSPINPSTQASSTSGPSTSASAGSSDTQGRAAKRVRRASWQETDFQTATSPPSRSQGEKKLITKLQTSAMQSDHGLGQLFVAGTPQQGHESSFMASARDIFSCPVSAPAPSVARSFWAPGSSMIAMDMSFTATDTDLPGCRTAQAVEWSKADDMLHQMDVLSSHMGTKTKTHRALAPKPPGALRRQGNRGHSDGDLNLYDGPFTAPADEPFEMGQIGSVDPGLLFSGPPSSGIEPGMFDPTVQGRLMQAMLPSGHLHLPVDRPSQLDLHLPASTQDWAACEEVGGPPASSPPRGPGQPSLSESRGRMDCGHAPLPGRKPASGPSRAFYEGNGDSWSQGSRRRDESSPLKYQHDRVGCLGSIPETAGLATRTSVKFIIDSTGRARAETTTVRVRDDDESMLRNACRGYASKKRSRRWDSSDDEQSSVDDPILIPSRNSSFTLPEPAKTTSSRSLRHSTNTSFTGQAVSSLGLYYGDRLNDDESEAESMYGRAGSDGGDATNELRRLVEERQTRAAMMAQPKRPGPGRPRKGASRAGMPPATLPGRGVPTPPPSQASIIRCICNSAQSPRKSDGFMVQCESCESWLHGKCININRRSLPKVYICAFCANTPKRNMTGPYRSGTGGRVLAASPLANKPGRCLW